MMKRLPPLKQIKKVNFLKELYAKAVAEPYGHLLIDLDPKTIEGLRYCSNIVRPGPTTFYLPSSRAKTTELTNER